MDMTASAAMAVPRATSARGWPPAVTLLGGTMLSLIGLTWDVQWHSDVGPDTFFTLPHLFLYAGSAVAGLTSLAVVLLTTARQRAGREIDPHVGGRVVGVFGKTFAAPVGYLVSGVGAALFLSYGLWDQWWHGLYGFDAVISSPPHIGLLLSVTITVIGSIMVFAAARDLRWGLAGTIGGIGVLLAFSAITVLGLQELEGGVVSATDVGVSFMSVLLVLVARGFFGKPGGALLAAAALAVLQAVFWWFSPWAAHAYADAVGLPIRDYVSGVPEMPSLMPMALVVVAALIELVLRRGTARWLPIAAGALGGLLVSGLQPWQRAWLYPFSPRLDSVLVTCAVATVLGALAGHLGWRFGGMLRLLAPIGERK
ncbi:hypothetical protein [Amycolatopsis minnesotensis]|uniref:Uncharacterized protein n=1 Tax=Amycolatopsis minnesotensis TaxID=337894 RepID=A0ABN2SFB7_9PSEU